MEDHSETGQGGPEWNEQVEEPAQPMFNVPTSILVLIVLFSLVHGLRYLLSPGQDLVFLIEMAFIPIRYVDGLFSSGIAGFTSFVSYNFLHGDLTHLGINSIWMLAMGSAVAKRIGTLRFLLFSSVCGLFAALAHLVTHWGEIVPVIGASGAISGHMAAAIRFIFSVPSDRHGAGMLHGNLRAIPLKPLFQALQDGRVLAILAIWMMTNVVSGLGIISVGDENPIAWEAHIGGFVAGLLLFRVFDRSGNGGGKSGDGSEFIEDADGMDQVETNTDQGS
ncbi:MAG: rhomboid family intramembrane serine protease [bacterium]|nr:rhomboid family intramembrane serine protease [bacterium]